MKIVTDIYPQENEVMNFYLSKSEKLFNNIKFRKNLLRCNNIFKITKHISNEFELFKNILKVYSLESQLVISNILKYGVNKNTSILEIGGGIGFVYGFLKSHGFDICSIEPSESCFNNYHEMGTEMFKTLHIDSSAWYKFKASECRKLGRKFDVIFSVNVMEHIFNLEETFSSLKDILKPYGIMIHETPNYFVPYDPHLRIFTFPFFPKYTYLLSPDIKKSEVWKGINFITSSKIERICKSNGLHIRFEKNILVEAFQRLENDKEFSGRHIYFLPILKILKVLNLISILNFMPPKFSTPMRFVVKNAAN